MTGAVVTAVFLTALEGFPAATFGGVEGAAFFGAVFLDLEGKESRRAMGLSIRFAGGRQAVTIPKSAPIGKPEQTRI
jgi:hypothetical protein